MLKLVNVFYLIARRDKKIIKMNTGRIKVWCFFSFFSEVLMYFCIFSPFCWSDFFFLLFSQFQWEGSWSQLEHMHLSSFRLDTCIIAE